MTGRKVLSTHTGGEISQLMANQCAYRVNRREASGRKNGRRGMDRGRDGGKLIKEWRQSLCFFEKVGKRERVRVGKKPSQWVIVY